MKIYEKTSKSKKQIFLESYNPQINIDIQKTADSFGVTIQMVYRWIRDYDKNLKK